MIPNKTSKSPGSLWIKKKESKFKSKSRFSDFLTRKLTCSSKLSISFIIIIYYNYYLSFFCFLPKVFFYYKVTCIYIYIFICLYLYFEKTHLYGSDSRPCTMYTVWLSKFQVWVCMHMYRSSPNLVTLPRNLVHVCYKNLRSEMSKEVYRGCKTILFFAF